MTKNLCRAVPCLLGALLVATPGCGNSHEVAPDAETPPMGPPPGSGPGVVPPGPCWSGTALPCECDDGRDGLLYCEDAAWLETCECAPAPVEVDAGVPISTDGAVADGGVPMRDDCLLGDPEWCDGRDNDCDWRIDEGHPCADPTVAHTLPHDGVVYVQVREGFDGPLSLRPLAAPSAPAISDFDEVPASGGVHWTSIVPANDGTLFYRYNRGVWYQRVVGAPDPEVVTAPCFDASRSLLIPRIGPPMYTCPPTLRRGDGEVLIADLERDGPAAVSDAGRVLLQGPEGRLTIRDLDGAFREVEGLGEWTGRFPDTWLRRTTVAGESVFHAIPRVYRGSSRHELVVFRIDLTDGTRRLVRRVPIRPAVRNWVALPDGRVFGGYNQELDRGTGQLIIEYPAHGAARVVWSDLSEGTRFEDMFAVNRTPG